MTDDRIKTPVFALALRTAIAVASAVVFLVSVARSGRGQDAAQGGGFDILRSIPFDRITLTDGTVLNIEPVSPRPLPDYDPTKDKEREAASRAKKRGKDKERDKEAVPEGGNIGLPGEKSKFSMPRKDDEEDDPQIAKVTIHLLEGDVRDFTVKRFNIRRLEYFEDMLLAEADRLALSREFAKAFECCLRVQDRNPAWKGLDDHVNRILFAEGSAALLDGDGDRGMRLLRELLARKPDFPGLTDKIATSFGERIAVAMRRGFYPKGRRTLHELEGLAPNHIVVREMRGRFAARAREWVEKAEKSQGSERLDALTEALRVWPTLEGADRLYTQAFAAEPTLDVAVNDLPKTLGPWVHSPAAARFSRLLFLPILERDDDEAAEGKAAPGQLAESLQASDLGRRMILKLRPSITWSDGSRAVSAIDVARALTDRTEPSSPHYNARWSDLLDRVETSDETRVEIRLTRPFLKPAAWLLGPVGPAHAGFDGRVATLDRGRLLVGDGPFRLDSASTDRLVLRARDDASEANRAKIRRLREIRYPTAKAAIGALVRGEVSLVEHVPADLVPGLADNPELKVGRFTRPTLHRIAIDGRNQALRNRSLRRGLSYAINRRGLLEETLLRHPPDGANTAADGPFAKGSYADAPDVKPVGYDPLLAKMLIAAARKELRDQPIRLTFAYPDLPEPQAVVPRIAEAFRLVGVEIKLEERPESALEAELRAGKRFDLAYRVSRCDEPVLEAGPLICPGFDAPPNTDALASVASPRILQLLLQLERAPEFPTARGIVLQIDRECRDELPVLPLWQLQDHYAWRTRLKGPADEAAQLYQGIDAWEIEPWFAKDSW